MILQALVRYYEDLAARGEISLPGWGPAKISYALCIDSDGRLQQIVSLKQEEQLGKKTVIRPQIFSLPAAVKRTVGVASNFLWDNAAYLLGLDAKGKPERSKACYEACKALHRQLLESVESDTARAILRFFEHWDPSQNDNLAVSDEVLSDLKAGANLLFRVNGSFSHIDPAVCEQWQSYYEQSDGVIAQCLVSGTMDAIEPVHPSIQGVKGAQSSGAALISFNAPAFCSYGKEQNNNAPVGKHAAFAYTTALNHLLADRNNVQHIGDTTIVCWAEGADPAYQTFAMEALFGDLGDNDLRAILKRLADGLPCEDVGLEASRPFYILGLAPNAARLSVRFFIRDSFGALMRNVNANHERMQIERPKYDPFEILPIWRMLQETSNPNSRDKTPSPVMAGAVVRAIFNDTLYPASLLNGTMLRIRAERDINRGKAAILKAYYLKNQNKDCPKEVLTVALNEESTNIPYTLGRLFSVYEAIQEAANPGINATIKDKYFNSAASTPGTIFPLLDNLSQKHLRKLNAGKKIFFEQQIMQLKGILGEENPLRLSLPEQGSFYLGYYHQTQKRYTKKEEQ